MLGGQTSEQPARDLGGRGSDAGRWELSRRCPHTEEQAMAGGPGLVRTARAVCQGPSAEDSAGAEATGPQAAGEAVGQVLEQWGAAGGF